MTTEKVDIPKRSLLRYHGAKFSMGPWIISHFPKHKTFVDVFGGGGSITLLKSPSQCDVYNDLWKEVVNLFKVMRDPIDSARLKELIYMTPFSRDELFLSCEPSEDYMEQARRTLVRSHFTFSPATFAPASGVTFAASMTDGVVHRLGEWLDWQEHLTVFTKRMRSVVIENWPATEVIPKYDTTNTLFYVDPPYVHDTRIQVGGGAGYAHEMTNDDHVKLATVLHRAKGMVILSGYHSPLYKRLYGSWEVIEKVVTSDRGQPRTEVLWLNPAASAARPRQLSMFDYGREDVEADPVELAGEFIVECVEPIVPMQFADAPTRPMKVVSLEAASLIFETEQWDKDLPEQPAEYHPDIPLTEYREEQMASWAEPEEVEVNKDVQEDDISILNEIADRESLGREVCADPESFINPAPVEVNPLAIGVIEELLNKEVEANLPDKAIRFMTKRDMLSDIHCWSGKGTFTVCDVEIPEEYQDFGSFKADLNHKFCCGYCRGRINDMAKPVVVTSPASSLSSVPEKPKAPSLFDMLG